MVDYVCASYCFYWDTVLKVDTENIIMKICKKIVKLAKFRPAKKHKTFKRTLAKFRTIPQNARLELF